VVISVRLTSASTAAAWLLEVRDGRIVRQTVWNDLAAIRRQLL
jgi:ketosteroid isomerase-like protein